MIPHIVGAFLNFDHTHTRYAATVVERSVLRRLLEGKMKTEHAGHDMTVTLEMEDGSVLHVVRDAIHKAQSMQDVWSLFLILPSGLWGSERMKLQELGFMPAGSVSADGVTRMKLRFAVRRSSDGGTLARLKPRATARRT